MMRRYVLKRAAVNPENANAARKRGIINEFGAHIGRAIGAVNRQLRTPMHLNSERRYVDKLASVMGRSEMVSIRIMAISDHQSA